MGAGPYIGRSSSRSPESGACGCVQPSSLPADIARHHPPAAGKGGADNRRMAARHVRSMRGSAGANPPCGMAPPAPRTLESRGLPFIIQNERNGVSTA